MLTRAITLLISLFRKTYAPGKSINSMPQLYWRLYSVEFCGTYTQVRINRIVDLIFLILGSPNESGGKKREMAHLAYILFPQSHSGSSRTGINLTDVTMSQPAYSWRGAWLAEEAKIPDDVGGQQWRGTQPWGHHPRRSQPSPGRSRCRIRARWSHPHHTWCRLSGDEAEARRVHKRQLGSRHPLTKA